MPGDLERLPAPVFPCRARRQWRAICWAGCGRSCRWSAVLGEREQFLVSAWLTGLRSARTRRAYAGDVVAWLAWLDRHGEAFALGSAEGCTLDLAAALTLAAGADDTLA